MSEEIKRVKFPKIFHLPWSEGAQDDDKTLTHETVDIMFKGKRVVVLEKLDGECTTMYYDGFCHARSIDSAPHESRSYVKSLAAKNKLHVPENGRVIGENVFAKHSIFYDSLHDYFYPFMVIEGHYVNSYDDTVKYANKCGLKTPPVLYRGMYDSIYVRACGALDSTLGSEKEGYVVRLEGDFFFTSLQMSVAKYVRKDHVQTDEHWLSKPIVRNKRLSDK